MSISACCCAGHTFCYRCLDEHLRHQKNCPACARFLTPDLTYPNFLLSKACGAGHGCPSFGSLHGDPAAHVQTQLACLPGCPHQCCLPLMLLCVTLLCTAPQISKRAHSRALGSAPSALELLQHAIADHKVPPGRPLQGRVVYMSCACSLCL